MAFRRKAAQGHNSENLPLLVVRLESLCAGLRALYTNNHFWGFRFVPCVGGDASERREKSSQRHNFVLFGDKIMFTRTFFAFTNFRPGPAPTGSGFLLRGFAEAIVVLGMDFRSRRALSER
jgi:hypothetical protein